MMRARKAGGAGMRAGAGPSQRRTASALTHSAGSALRLTLLRMALADLVQVKGRGSSLCSAMERLIAVWRSTSERKSPRRSRRRVRAEKKVSTALIQEAEVGVKWKIQRG